MRTGIVTAAQPRIATPADSGQGSALGRARIVTGRQALATPRGVALAGAGELPGWERGRERQTGTVEAACVAP